jgi:hypothetical protein
MYIKSAPAPVRPQGEGRGFAVDQRSRVELLICRRRPARYFDCPHAL